MSESSYSENVKVSEGISHDGVETTLSFEGESLIVNKTYDAEPHLKYAEDARIATAGMRWGEGRLVGHIPPAQYGKFLAIRDNKDRMKAIKAWLIENNKFVMFDKFLR